MVGSLQYIPVSAKTLRILVARQKMQRLLRENAKRKHQQQQHCYILS